MKTRYAIRIFSLLLLTVFAIGQSRSRTYTIVPSESSFWVFVGKSGFFSALAHNHEIGVKSFSGRVVVPAAGAGAGSLEMEVDAPSLEVLDKEPSEEDKKKIFNSMHNEVLESAKYQKITFKSVSVSDVKQAGSDAYSFVVNGDLSLHGVMKRIAVPVAATVTPQQLRATGKYTLKQTDYGIRPYSAAGGTIKVKDEVVVNFNIVAKAG
ncbi:MAG TPA: YceI family protein [Blastocatellia bacterium]|nr:YceI family protein [Blastocatellia bacterium]